MTLYWLGTCAVLAAGLCALHGWLRDRPTDATRLTWRVWTWIWMLGFFAVATVRDSRDGRWLLAVLNAVFALASLYRVEHWWRLREKQAIIERIRRAQMGGPHV